MTSAKGKLVRVLAGFALERAFVQAVERIGGFRRLQLRWDGKPFSAGTKVQLLLPTDDMRTYTPIRSAEGFDLLGWKHGEGPGSRWLDEVRAGDELPFVGPQRSLSLDPGPVVIVGDETSVAVALAFATERPGQVRAVIQADAVGDVRDAVRSAGLGDVVVVARGDTGATVAAVVAKLSTSARAAVGVTGGSELVVQVRDGLRQAGLRSIKTKPYWIPGKTGLD